MDKMDQSYDELLAQKAKLELYSQVVLRLSQTIQIQNLDWRQALELITKTVSQTMRIGRVSVWMIGEQEMICEKLYEKGKGYSSGQTLAIHQFPVYFEAIRTRYIICAQDAWTHPHTLEFVPEYLPTNQIRSMLDVAFFLEGKVAGVICCENQHEVKVWDNQEINLAQSLGDIVLLAYKTSLRRQYELKIKEQNAKLEEQSRELLIREEELRQNMDELLATQDLLAKQLDKQQKRTAQSQTLTNLAKKLINGNFFEGLHEVTRDSARATGADRSYVFIKRENRFYCVSEYWVSEPQPIQFIIKGVESHALDWLIEKMSETGAVFLRDTRQIPTEGAAFAQMLEKNKVASALFFPIWFQNSIQGFIGFEVIHRSEQWDQDEIDMLNILSEILSAAYSRHLAVLKLERRTLFERNAFNFSQLILTAPLSQLISHLVSVIPNRSLSLLSSKLEIISGQKVKLTEQQIQLIQLTVENNLPYSLHDLGDDSMLVVPVVVENQIKYTLVGIAEGIFADEEIFFLSNAGRMLGYYFAKQEYEEQLRAAKDRAEQAALAKSQFLANMSHEIRTPMNAVLGFADLLAEIVTDPRQQAYVESIRSGGRTLLTIINDILDLSKIEAGKLTLKLEPTDIQALMREVEQFFSLKISQKGLKFFIMIQSGLPNLLLLDEIRLRQVLFNLVGNAVKFTDKGCITISLTYQQTSSETVDLQIAVADTGIGISPADLNIIFESFGQSVGLNSKKYGGTGLGLSISQKLVSMMKGTIGVESELNKGSVFTVYLPNTQIATLTPQSQKASPLPEPAFHLLGKCILVADDVLTNRLLVKEYLLPTGCKIIEAENGIQAVEIAKMQLPDLIFMDIRMPIADGIQATLMLKSDRATAHIPVIALTASALPQDRERIEVNGFDGFLTKPIQKEVLFRELARFFSANTSPNPPAQTHHEPPANKIAAFAGYEDMYQKWERVCSENFVDDIEAFAREIGELSTQMNYEDGVSYAALLAQAAAGFDVIAMTDLLAKFPYFFPKET